MEQVLDMRLRGADIDPSTYWMIDHLAGMIEWDGDAYMLLSKAEGYEALRGEVLRRVEEGNESQVTIGYWWLMLARMERKILKLTPEEVGESYARASEAFAAVLDADDPIRIMVDRERVEAAATE